MGYLTEAAPADIKNTDNRNPRKTIIRIEKFSDQPRYNNNKQFIEYIRNVQMAQWDAQGTR